MPTIKQDSLPYEIYLVTCTAKAKQQAMVSSIYVQHDQRDRKQLFRAPDRGKF